MSAHRLVASISLLSLSALVASPVLAEPGQYPGGTIQRALDLEAALKKDGKKLRLRQNAEALIRAWETAVRQSRGAERVAAREGEARAWKLLAHWSGSADDRDRVREAERRVASERALAVVPVAAPAKGGEGMRGRWLSKVSIEVEGDRFAAVLPIHHEVSVRRQVIAAAGDRAARVYFDVSPLIASREALRTLAIEHGVIERLRVGQVDGDTVRFVLDVQAGRRLPERVEFVPGAPAQIIVASAEVPARVLSSAPPVAPPEVLAAAPTSSSAASAAVVAPSSVEPPSSEDDPEDPLSALLRVRLDRPPSTPRAAPPASAPAAVEVPAAPAPVAIEPPSALVTEDVIPAILEAAEAQAGLPPVPPAARRDSLVKIRRVVIDAGHGGKDTGAIGKRGTREKDVNLGISLRLGKALEKLGVEVIYTRSQDSFISLARRAEIANHSNADLFISVHANAHKNGKVAGIETYYLDTTSSRWSSRIARRENSDRAEALDVDVPEPEAGGSEDDEGSLPGGSLGRDLRLLLADLAMRSATEESRRLAGYVQSSVISRARGAGREVKDLGVKHALFFVLVGARMPSVLIESGFLSHADEEARLASAAYQNRLAAGIAFGVKRFIEERNAIAAR